MAWFFFLILLLSCFLLGFVGLRFFKATAMLFALTGTGILQAFILVFADHLVNWMMDCRPATGISHPRLWTSLDRVLRNSGLWYTPRLYISHKEGPNAFAYGSLLMGSSSVAVTQTLYEMMDDEELDAVLAHELGHLRSHDVLAMTLVSVTLSLIQWMARSAVVGFPQGRLFLQVLVNIITYIPRVIASGISQVRELAADAASVATTGQTKPLMRALRKLESWQPADGEKVQRHTTDPLSELLLTHPNTEARVRFLSELES